MKIEYSTIAILSLGVISKSASEEGTQEVDILGMDDAEFEKLNPNNFDQSIEENNESEESSEDESEEESTDNDEEEESLGDDEEDTEGGSDDTDEDEDSAADEDNQSQSDEPQEESEDQPDDLTPEMYEQIAKHAIAPLKASGKTVKVRDVEHLRALAQMGIDYNKKLHELKPHRQTLKTLEREGILGDPEEINLLLEARRGNPDAIKKLIASAEIDPLDLADPDAINNARDYSPDNHLVDEREINIEEAINEIKNSEHYQRTIDTIANDFDEKSRIEISDNPHYIKALNSDMETGVFDQVMEIVQYQKDIGAVPSNVSDIQLYIQTVQQLAAEEQRRLQEQQSTESQAAKSKSKKQSVKKKVAMGGSRKSKKKNTQSKYNPLEMSDEDFMNLPDLPPELKRI